LKIELRHDIAYRVIDGTIYILTPDSRLHSISDPVGAGIFLEIERKKGVSEKGLLKALKKSFETPESMEGDVRSFLCSLSEKGIIVLRKGGKDESL